MYVIIYYIDSSNVSVTYGGSLYSVPILSGSGGFLAGVAVAVLVATSIIVIRLDNIVNIYTYFLT